MSTIPHPGPLSHSNATTWFAFVRNLILVRPRSDLSIQATVSELESLSIEDAGEDRKMVVLQEFVGEEARSLLVEGDFEESWNRLCEVYERAEREDSGAGFGNNDFKSVGTDKKDKSIPITKAFNESSMDLPTTRLPTLPCDIILHIINYTIPALTYSSSSHRLSLLLAYSTINKAFNTHFARRLSEVVHLPNFEKAERFIEREEGIRTRVLKMGRGEECEILGGKVETLIKMERLRNVRELWFWNMKDIEWNGDTIPSLERFFIASCNLSPSSVPSHQPASLFPNLTHLHLYDAHFPSPLFFTSLLSNLPSILAIYYGTSTSLSPDSLIFPDPEKLSQNLRSFGTNMPLDPSITAVPLKFLRCAAHQPLPLPLSTHTSIFPPTMQILNITETHQGHYDTFPGLTKLSNALQFVNRLMQDLDNLPHFRTVFAPAPFDREVVNSMVEHVEQKCGEKGIEIVWEEEEEDVGLDLEDDEGNADEILETVEFARRFWSDVERYERVWGKED